jgi:prophage regulatory protein
MSERVLRLRHVEEKTGLKHTYIYMLMAAGTFPKQIKLSPKARGWIESEIDAWIAARIAERDGTTGEAA